MKGRIKIDKRGARRGLCIVVCPKKNIEISDKLISKATIRLGRRKRTSKDSERQCTGCAMCAITCPDVAIEVYREAKGESEHKSHHHEKKIKKSKKS